MEVEVYHVFSKDSAVPPSGRVPLRLNSPADVEIESATRDGELGTLVFRASLVAESFTVQNTVVDGINPVPANVTHGEGAASGEAVQITVAFTPPIVLPPDHYFFRPEVQVAGGNFLFLSAPKPIVAPGTPFAGDLQSWIRNTDLKPDWLRIGTDIIADSPVRTFNATFSLTGETVPQAATPTPTATPTDPPSSNGGGDCSIGTGSLASARTLWFPLAPAAPVQSGQLDRLWHRARGDGLAGLWRQRVVAGRAQAARAAVPAQGMSTGATLCES